MTKAAFFYIGIIFVLLLFLPDRIMLIRQPDARSLRQLRVTYAMLFAAFLVTLAPWVVRHVIILGKPGISSRAEGVLGLRMLLNEQPPLGTIYASSPKPLKQRLGPLLGYSPTDLKAGGKLDGISFVKQRAWGIYEQRMEEESYDGKVDSWIRRSTLSKPPYPRHQLRGVP